MSALERRLERLESHVTEEVDREVTTFLASLPDADLDFLAEAGERILAGESFDDLPAEMRARYAAIRASREERYAPKEATG